MKDCLFCKIVAGEIPCAKVFEDGSVLAFLDINPAAKGHTLVIPKKHFETLAEMPDAELGKLAIAVRDIAKAVVKETKTQGFNVVQSNGTAAEQEIPHVHFHIVPRFVGDGIGMRWKRAKYSSGAEMAGLAEKILKLTENERR
ncbi:MAG: HIT family protein [archaeon]